ncbi:hypothetical protein [uncultured Ruminococcus sp.]|nr:hypothetical protein [uncultured Ruminococcus sp.]
MRLLADLGCGLCILPPAGWEICLRGGMTMKYSAVCGEGREYTIDICGGT